MKLQIVSDIHLEFLDSNEFDLLLQPSAPLLIMAGDISTHDCQLLPEFLTFVSQNFERVLWIMGNHEYYDVNGTGMGSILQKLKGMCPHNVSILDNEVWDTGDLVIAGTTLWSRISEQYGDKIERSVRDFRCIYKTDGVLLTTNDVNHMHEDATPYLQSVLDAYGTSGKMIVIVTHHMPIVQGYDPLATAFATDVQLLNDKNVALWICGHSHHNFVATKRHYKVVTNQFGYEGEHTGTSYKFDYVVTL